MKKFILFLALITMPHLAIAEEVEISTNGKVSIPLEIRSQGVYVQFTFSDAMTKEVRKRLASVGYTLVDDKSRAWAVINISGELFIKDQGVADLGKYLESRSSADFARREDISSPSNTLDGGVIHESSKLTGGLGSGIILAGLIGVISDATGLTGAINRARVESSESAKNVKVTVFAWTKTDNRRQIFSTKATTNKFDYDTSELITSALSSALEVLN
jgi:hypothetical protein